MVDYITEFLKYMVSMQRANQDLNNAEYASGVCKSVMAQITIEIQREESALDMEHSAANKMSNMFDLTGNRIVSSDSNLKIDYTGEDFYGKAVTHPATRAAVDKQDLEAFIIQNTDDQLKDFGKATNSTDPMLKNKCKILKGLQNAQL